MLVLTRHIGEAIDIGDNIKLIVLGLNRSQVRLGFEAPPELKIHREEISNRIKTAKTAPKEIEDQVL